MLLHPTRRRKLLKKKFEPPKVTEVKAKKSVKKKFDGSWIKVGMGCNNSKEYVKVIGRKRALFPSMNPGSLEKDDSGAAKKRRNGPCLDTMELLLMVSD